MPYLIDGHNLIHFVDGFDLDDPDDEAKLVLKLRGFCARKRKKCVVVFDEGLPGGTSSMSTPSVQVVFASSRQSNADRIIRERIRNTRDVKGWIVVSSDNEILDEAKNMGMRGIKSAEFAQRLQSPKKQQPHVGLQEQVSVSGAEVEEWLSVFEYDEDPDENEAQVTRTPQAVIPSPIKEKKPQKPQKQTQKNAHAPYKTQDLPPRKGQTDEEIDYWLETFGEQPQRIPTDPRLPRRKKKKKENSAKQQTPAELHASEEYKDDTLQLSDNSVEAWMELFPEPDPSLEPTDPAPQRSDPNKQGRYKSHDGKRHPTVHKRMATSDEIYLSSGEVEAWMDVFGVDDEDS